MNIAIFSDLHGRLLLAFKLVLRYQIETGIKIDCILQCGDIGVYPYLENMDKATIRHAQKDPSELGFSKYFLKPNNKAEEILSKLDCKMICVRGNHEDHNYLDNLEFKLLEPLFPVDCYKKVYVLNTGEVYILNNAINILGIGRIAPPIGETDLQNPKYIQEYELYNIYKIEKNVDIVISHDASKDFVEEGYGLEEIQMVLDEFKPLYHFYGHTMQRYVKKVSSNGITIVSKLSDLSWNDDGSLKEDSFGILSIDENKKHTFEPVREKWIREYTRYNWEYI